MDDEVQVLLLDAVEASVMETGSRLVSLSEPRPTTSGKGESEQRSSRASITPLNRSAPSVHNGDGAGRVVQHSLAHRAKQETGERSPAS
jgi:hypothetical protein